MIPEITFDKQENRPSTTTDEQAQGEEHGPTEGAETRALKQPAP